MLYITYHIHIYIYIYLFIWRFRIKGWGLFFPKNSDRYPRVFIFWFWQVVAASGGEGPTQDFGDQMGAVQGSPLLLPFLFAPTCSKHMWSRARPFEARGGG